MFIALDGRFIIIVVVSVALCFRYPKYCSDNIIKNILLKINQNLSNLYINPLTFGYNIV